jgi:hypothetical protein
MKSVITFDLALTEDGLGYDIRFKETECLLEEPGLGNLAKEEDVISIKTNNEKLIQIKENPLIEQCEECEEGDESVSSVDDFSDEEDTSIINVYEEVRYITFPDMKSVYTEKDMEYVGSKSECEASLVRCMIDFTPMGKCLHKQLLTIS